MPGACCRAWQDTHNGRLPPGASPMSAIDAAALILPIFVTLSQAPSATAVQFTAASMSMPTLKLVLRWLAHTEHRLMPMFERLFQQPLPAATSPAIDDRDTADDRFVDEVGIDSFQRRQITFLGIIE